jgi:hypothetical protein
MPVDMAFSREANGELSASIVMVKETFCKHVRLHTHETVPSFARSRSNAR